MKFLQQYLIPFSGLKIGKHVFEYEINEQFFKEFEYSLVQKGSLNVALEFDKQETMLVLNFRIDGEVFQNCDVCLADFPTPLNLEQQEIVKFSNDELLEDNVDELIVLNKNENEIDVSALIYEYIMLGVPTFNRCKEEGKTTWCDAEMLETLKKLAAPEEKTEEVADPRWEALKNITNKNK